MLPDEIKNRVTDCIKKVREINDKTTFKELSFFNASGKLYEAKVLMLQACLAEAFKKEIESGALTGIPELLYFIKEDTTVGDLVQTINDNFVS